MHFPSALLLAALCAGCASTLNKGRQSLLVQSGPSGANVTVNGQERGTTPFQYDYDQEDGRQVKFEVYKSGHRPVQMEMRPRSAPGVLFVNAMLLHLPFIADHRNPAHYTIPVSHVTLDLYREFSPDLARFALPVSGFTTELDGRSTLGTHNGKPLRWNKNSKNSVLRGQDEPDRLAQAVVEGLRDTWLDSRTARSGTTKGDEALQRAKLHLKPHLRGLRATLTGERTRCYGPVEMELEWRVMSTLRMDSVLFTIPMRTTYNAIGDRGTELVYASVVHAARVLAQDPDLPEQLARHFGSGLARSKGGEVEINRPKTITFSGRKDMLSALVKAVVTVQAGNRLGSGFVISNEGHLITNEHVVGREAVVKVRFEQGFSLDAQVVKVNKDFDLALLKVQATDLPALTIGDDTKLMLGEELFAIGTPLDMALGQSVSRGILSGRRELDGRTLLQTDVSINPGNSGGPLVDEDGKVVGVATMKLSGKGLEGLGFGVPISVAMEMLNIQMKP